MKFKSKKPKEVGQRAFSAVVLFSTLFLIIGCSTIKGPTKITKIPTPNLVIQGKKFEVIVSDYTTVNYSFRLMYKSSPNFRVAGFHEMESNRFWVIGSPVGLYSVENYKYSLPIYTNGVNGQFLPNFNDLGELMYHDLTNKYQIDINVSKNTLGHELCHWHYGLFHH